MTENSTDTTVPVPGKQPTPRLNAALAKLQAGLPKVKQDKTAKIESEKGNRSYDYADLEDVSDKVLPLLGSLGLAFTAFPGLNGQGKFGLEYELLHESGESKDGFFPIPSNASPQQIGSWITYARRYCLCAVTGVAPGDEDDDGAAAENGYRHSRGEAPHGEAPRGRVTRPQSAREQAAQAKAAGGAAGDDSDWGVAVAGTVTVEDCDNLETDLKAAFNAGRLNQVKAEALRKMLNARRDKIRAAGATA